MTTLWSSEAPPEISVDRGFKSLQPHPIFKGSDDEPTGDDDPEEYRCRHGRRWCPGPKALKHGILPCLDCYRDPDDELVDAYEEYDLADQSVATPRNGGGPREELLPAVRRVDAHRDEPGRDPAPGLSELYGGVARMSWGARDTPSQTTWGPCGRTVFRRAVCV